MEIKPTTRSHLFETGDKLTAGSGCPVSAHLQPDYLVAHSIEKVLLASSSGRLNQRL
ncbi:MAG: hypothetical protein V3S39_01990 [Thermodesulfobacteriota bacterium]